MAEDGQDPGADVVQSTSETVAALVVVQEIFGVNRNLCSVDAGYAKDGFLAGAPDLFDRIESSAGSDYIRAER